MKVAVKKTIVYVMTLVITVTSLTSAFNVSIFADETETETDYSDSYKGALTFFNAIDNYGIYLMNELGIIINSLYHEPSWFFKESWKDFDAFKEWFLSCGMDENDIVVDEEGNLYVSQTFNMNFYNTITEVINNEKGYQAIGGKECPYFGLVNDSQREYINSVIDSGYHTYLVWFDRDSLNNGSIYDSYVNGIRHMYVLFLKDEYEYIFEKTGNTVTKTDSYTGESITTPYYNITAINSDNALVYHHKSIFSDKVNYDWNQRVFDDGHSAFKFHFWQLSNSQLYNTGCHDHYSSYNGSTSKDDFVCMFNSFYTRSDINNIAYGNTKIIYSDFTTAVTTRLNGTFAYMYSNPDFSAITLRLNSLIGKTDEINDYLFDIINSLEGLPTQAEIDKIIASYTAVLRKAILEGSADIIAELQNSQATTSSFLYNIGVVLSEIKEKIDSIINSLIKLDSLSLLDDIAAILEKGFADVIEAIGNIKINVTNNIIDLTVRTNTDDEKENASLLDLVSCILYAVLILGSLIDLFFKILEYIILMFQIPATPALFNEYILQGWEYAESIKIPNTDFGILQFLRLLMYITLVFGVVKVIKHAIDNGSIRSIGK